MLSWMKKCVRGGFWDVAGEGMKIIAMYYIVQYNAYIIALDQESAIDTHP